MEFYALSNGSRLGGEVHRDDQQASYPGALFFHMPTQYYGNPLNPYAPRQPGPGTPSAPQQQGPNTGLGPSGAGSGASPGYYGTPYQSPYQPAGPSLGNLQGAVPPTRPPGSYILQDSNPGLFNQRPQPILAKQPQLTAGRLGEVIGGAPGGGSGSGQMQGNAGGILGSSVGPPSFYGAGLSPASGLGGGLYPSLVSLYR